VHSGGTVAYIDTIVDGYAYNLWGVPTLVSETVSQQLRYDGYWYDTETGWYWLQIRAYDPLLKRFLQPDPSGQDGQFSYAYAGDDPVDMSDPTGLDAAAVAAIVNETACDDDPSGGACAAEERARQAMLAAPSYLPIDSGSTGPYLTSGDGLWVPAPATAYAGSAAPSPIGDPKPGSYQVGQNTQAVRVIAEPGPQVAAIIADPDLANGTKGVDNGAVYQYGGAQYGGTVGTGVIQGTYVQRCTDGQCYQAREYGNGNYGPWYATEHGLEIPAYQDQQALDQQLKGVPDSDPYSSADLPAPVKGCIATAATAGTGTVFVAPETVPLTALGGCAAYFVWDFFHSYGWI